ncbi:hypothetical protein pkur_cds_572 [Pandoravirus kuranda]|uniref:Uncharacterized protein n=1 Tax=Pandoravirus kuranda TaxID=3019033 RepID=A0AA95J7V2_9VIRU|nr:hypothetical protein pkur_cds_572 [Pandoravirus kuranda]
MTGLAVIVFGAAAAMAGFVVGTAATGVAVLVGPRVLNLVSFYVSAIALAVLGCAAWFWMNGQSSANGYVSPGDIRPIIEQFSILAAVAGYTIACSILLGASALWGSTVPGGHDTAKLLIGIVVAVLCVPFTA